MKCYTNLSRSLTNYINHHEYFLSWFFNCFYLRRVIKIAWVINRKNFTSATKFIFLIDLISVNFFKVQGKMLQMPHNLKFSESIRKTCDEYPSARTSKPNQLNTFNILILFMIVTLLLYFLITFQYYSQVCLNCPCQFFSYFLFVN